MKKPTVGFDAWFLEHPMTGMGQYSLRLWNELRQRDDLDARLLYPADAPGHVLDAAGDRGVAVNVPGGGRMPGKLRKVWWEQSGVRSAARKAGVDLLHIPYFAAPIRKPCPLVVTIHDAIPVVLPEYAGGLLTRSYIRLVGRASRKADLVLTDSRHAAGDIASHLNIPLDRIEPVLLAAGEEYTPARDESDRARIDDLRERLGLGDRFILNVGGFDKRKNLPLLVEAFARALPGLDEPADLVIVGSPHSGNPVLFPDVRPVINRHGIGERVKLTGFVSEQDKLDLYRAASLFVFPSLYEGFGLNPLEAMACGTPVISSNRSSLPEVVGDGGITVKPEVNDLSQAIVTVMNDPELQRQLSERGLQQAATMTWQQTAEQTIRAYWRVLR